MMKTAMVVLLLVGGSVLCFSQGAPDSLGFQVYDDWFANLSSGDEDATWLETTALYPNYPNPFNATTEIAFDLPQSCSVEVAIYDVLGQQVSVLVSGYWMAGHHTVNFDGTGLPSGVYFCRLNAPGVTQTNRMMLLK